MDTYTASAKSIPEPGVIYKTEEIVYDWDDLVTIFGGTLQDVCVAAIHRIQTAHVVGNDHRHKIEHDDAETRELMKIYFKKLAVKTQGLADGSRAARGMSRAVKLHALGQMQEKIAQMQPKEQGEMRTLLKQLLVR